jgi:aminopeptidase N
MPSLARIDAAERAALLTVSNYRVALDLPAGGPEFRSDTTITFRCATPGSGTFLDLRPASIELIELNGRPLDPATLADGRLPLTGLAAENTLRVVAQMSYSSDGEGLHRHVDPADGRPYLYAMSFLDAAPRWFACFDQPDLKATYDLQVTCPPDWIVLGNSPARQVDGEPGHWRLATSKPLSTYFVTLVAGPYVSVTAEHDGIPLGVHARASLAAHLADEAEDMLAITRASFDAYHRLFDLRYPFGEYHQVFVPDFNAGAMENPGCVTLRDSYVFRAKATSGERLLRATTIAHEMAHMWFGDLVTMRWWDDLWLNESFAEYLAYRVCAAIPGYTERQSWIQFGITRKDWGAVADQAPSTHPIAGNGSQTADEALNDFDGISYAKGASALRQLAAHLGDEVFFEGLRRHFARHRYGNAELNDLLGAWTAAGAADMPEWAAQWLQTSGLDTLTAEAGAGSLTLRRSSPDASRRPHTVRLAGFDRTGRRLLDEPVTLTGDSVSVPAPAGVALAIADAGDQTWAKVRFGAGWQVVAELLGHIEDGSTRVVGYNALRDAVRNSDLSPTTALDALLPLLAVEPVEPVLAEMFGFATGQLAGVYCPPAGRPQRRARVLSAASAVLEAAAPGSDRQLAAARAVIRACDDPAPLGDWLQGRSLPEGLVIDAELRWAALTRLAALGGLSEADIAGELAADPSAAGAVHAARARASRPDAAAKAAAWASLTEPGALPAYELYAIASAFFEPAQAELIGPYLPRFFDEMARTARFRDGWALGQVITVAFPVMHPSAELVADAERALAGPLDAGVRRAFVDGTEILRRALTSRRRYGGGVIEEPAG